MTGDVFRIQDETAELSQTDMANFLQLILDADRRELKQFLDFGVWGQRHRSSLPGKVNLVDCAWFRKWAKDGTAISTVCARWCRHAETVD